MTALHIIETRKMTEFGVHLRTLIEQRFPKLADFQRRVAVIRNDGTKRQSPSRLYHALNGTRRIDPECMSWWALALGEDPAEFEILYDRPGPMVARLPRGSGLRSRPSRAKVRVPLIADPATAVGPYSGNEDLDDSCISLSVDQSGMATLRINLSGISIDLALRVVGLINNKAMPAS